MKQVAPARFKFVNFIVQESHIILRERGQYEFMFEFKPSGTVYPSLGQFELHLDLSVREKENRVDIDVRTIAVFEFEETEDIENNQYFTTNAPAIVFPFIRAYIANLTAQSGAGTIMMPTFNMTLLAEDLKKNISIQE